jgi:hypothetical protein
MPRFAPEAEKILRAGGWTPARSDAAFADLCSSALDRPGGFAMHPAARSAIQEFGGLAFGEVGAGVDFARSDVVFDPRLAIGEEDRLHDYFEELRGRAAYPLGECHHGHAFLAIDSEGRAYEVGDDVYRGASLDALLEGLLLGRRQSIG